MFNKLLIANRGEIACRIIKTAKRLGIRCVAIYSEADSGSLHVKQADEAYCVGPAASSASYLNIPRIIEVAEACCADAIHPGYGFLAENAAFAQAVCDAGITFIGPSAKAIDAMGSKIRSKELMAQIGIPMVPSYHGNDQSLDTMKSQAEAIGFPVLLKASAGGGGKGMRIINHIDEFADAFHGAKREALKSFHNDELLIEQYLEKPRHIEVQVFADTQGECIHLFERDCSIQRRYQKVIEEAPAPGITDKLRKKITTAAVDAAKAIDYVGAGTIEFLVKGNNFYFMEMNTRLQVEHPVTEMITGIDLVEWQLRIAAGEALPLKQSDIKIHGHAIEARIYAENPKQAFLPASGTIHQYHTPNVDEFTRIDSGIGPGDGVSPYYDPMIAKLICWGENRKKAISRLYNALTDFNIGLSGL